MVRSLLGICTLALFPFCLFADNPFFLHFDTQHGLPSPEVYDVDLDVNGMPWFATDRGVCSYNGYEFKTYSSRDGLPDNSCLGIDRGPDGSLWFFGLNGRLCYQIGDSIRAFERNDELQELLGLDRIAERLIWGDQGEIYMCYWGGLSSEVVSYWPDEGRFRLENFADSTGRNAAFQFEEANYFEFNGFFVPDTFAPRLFEDHLGAVHTYTFGGRVRKKALGEETFQEYDLGKYIRKLYLDSRKDLWVVTVDGLFRFADGDLETEPMAYFKGLDCSSLLEDREGNFWLTTLDDGVFLIPSFDILGLEAPDEVGDRISRLAALPDHLLFTTSDKEKFALSPTGEFAEWDAPLDLGIQSPQPDGGTVMLDRFLAWEEEGSLRAKAVSKPSYRRVVLKLENGDVFMGGHGGYDVRREGGILPVDGNFSSRVHAVMQDGNRLWVGAIDGLWLIEDGDYAHCRRVLPEVSLLHTRINDIQPDGYGNLWLSTIGNSLLHLKDSTVVRVDFGAGFPSDLVNAAALERPGVLWAACTNGLRRIRYACGDHLQVLQVQSLTIEDGLPDNYLVDVVAWQDRIWVATTKGIAHFPSELLDQIPEPPEVPLMIKSVRADAEPLPLGAVAKLPHDRNNLAFQFLGVAVQKPKEGSFYKYALVKDRVGANSPVPVEWVYTNDRIVRFQDLAPGDYRFWVAACNRSGEWGDPQTYAFVIEPHFSQTVAFAFLVALVSLVLVTLAFAYFAWRYRQRQNQRRKLQVAQLRAQEAEISTLRSQMNPHFVFNALNSIQNFIFRKDVLKANHFLSQFSSLIRDGLRFSRQERIPLSEELSFLNAYLELESMRFPERFDYRIDVDERLDCPRTFIPPFLFQPIIENAVKHAFKDLDCKGSLSMCIEKIDPNWLRVEVQDNGMGVNEEEVRAEGRGEKSLGLKIVRDRVKLLQTESRYSAASFELVNLQREGGRGTCARFHIPIQI